MRNLIEIAAVSAAIVLLSGCTQLESIVDKIGGVAHEQQVVTRTNVVNTPLGPIEVVNSWTNFTVRPQAQAAANVPQELGVPFGSLITFVLTSALAITAAFRSRQYRKGMLSALDAGNQFKDELKKHNIDISSVIASVVKDQKNTGTFPLIKKLLNLL